MNFQLQSGELEPKNTCMDHHVLTSPLVTTWHEGFSRMVNDSHARFDEDVVRVSDVEQQISITPYQAN